MIAPVMRKKAGRRERTPHLTHFDERLQKLLDGDGIVKLSNFSGPNAIEAIRIYGEQVLPGLRS